jgi:hypothetical protein
MATSDSWHCARETDDADMPKVRYFETENKPSEPPFARVAI